MVVLNCPHMTWVVPGESTFTLSKVDRSTEWVSNLDLPHGTTTLFRTNEYIITYFYSYKNRVGTSIDIAFALDVFLCDLYITSSNVFRHISSYYHVALVSDYTLFHTFLLLLLLHFSFACYVAKRLKKMII